MGLFTPDDRERAKELADQADRRPAETAAAVAEEGLLSADDEAARVYAARAMADAAEREPGAVLAHVEPLRARLDDEADVRSEAERALERVADHRRDRGRAALDRAERHLDAGERDRAREALDDARERFDRAAGVFGDGPSSDVVLDETVGVETVDAEGEALFSPLLSAGAELPASADWEFTTRTDGQSSVGMRVRRAPGAVEAERPLADGDEVLAALRLTNLPPAPAGVPVLAVGVEVAADGAVTARLVDRGSGERVEEPAGTAAVRRDAAGAVDPDRSAVPDGAEKRLQRLEARLDAEAVPPTDGARAGGADGTASGRAVDGVEGATADEATGDTDGHAAGDTGGAQSGGSSDAGGDAGADEPARGPGKRASPGARGARASTPAAATEGPDDRAVELLLDVRDDLGRALAADTDDPSVIRKGVEMTARKLDGFDGDGDGTVAAVRAALEGVLDGGDSADTVRERAREARDRVDAVLADAGVAVIDPGPGVPSDADRHRVVGTEPSDRPAGEVLDVEGSGYERDGAVGRPAKVRVSAGDDASVDAGATSDDGSVDAGDHRSGDTSATDDDGGTGAEPADGSPESVDGAPDPAEPKPAPEPAEPKPAPEPAEPAGAGSPGDGPPATVPGGPSLALGHDDLTGREVLGRGGDDEVYRATVDEGGRTHQVAVTELPADVPDERFAAAVERWATVDDHDHVVDVVDWGTDPVPWVAAEYADGGSLADLGDGVDLPRAVWTATRVADAVAHAHRHGVGHFDLKPSAVVLRAADGAWPAPKVADWGVGGLLLERADRVEGSSPRYAAPEQLDERYGTPDGAADVHAVGALAYELVTGRPPFTGRLDRVVEGILETEPTPPAELNPAVPDALDAAIRQAMAKHPDDRHANARALQEALEAVLADLR